METFQQIEERDDGARGQHANGNAPAHQPGELVDGEARTGDGFERGAGVWEHGGACLGEAHGASSAIEQRLAKLML